MKQLIIMHPEGKNSKQFYFTLKAANNEVIATPEFYKNKQGIKKLHKKHFSSFSILDKTLAGV